MTSPEGWCPACGKVPTDHECRYYEPNKPTYEELVALCREYDERYDIHKKRIAELEETVRGAGELQAAYRERIAALEHYLLLVADCHASEACEGCPVSKQCGAMCR